MLLANIVCGIIAAVIFHHIGNSEHFEKGGTLVTISIMLSIIGAYGWDLKGLFIANGLLYVGIFIYNLFKRPPKSRSKF